MTSIKLVETLSSPSPSSSEWCPILCKYTRLSLELVPLKLPIRNYGDNGIYDSTRAQKTDLVLTTNNNSGASVTTVESESEIK